MDPKFFKELNPLGIGMRPKSQTLEQVGVKIERADEKDWEGYKEIRMKALAKEDSEGHSKYFQHDLEAERNKTDQEWINDFKESIIFLAKHGSRVVGVIKSSLVSDKETEVLWRINSVYVNEKYKESKCGAPVMAEVLKKLLEEIRKNGATKARLWVLKNNLEAIHLYEKCGFRETSLGEAVSAMGGNPKYLTEWKIMTKDLTVSEK